MYSCRLINLMSTIWFTIITPEAGNKIEIIAEILRALNLISILHQNNCSFPQE